MNTQNVLTGGTSPGMPRQNIEAMLAALEEFNGKRVVA
jgi:hypothetical protein